MSDKEKKDNIKKVNGIFEMNVKSGSNEATYTIDLKKVRMGARSRPLLLSHEKLTVLSARQEGKVYKGPAKPKADGELPTLLRSPREPRD